jgi:transcriptional regulator with AAA-type ATPase domain
MTLRDALSLSRHRRPVRSFLLEDAPLEIGSDPSCDIALHCDEVAARALLVQPFGGSVYYYDLAEAPALGRRSVFPIDEPLELGGGYAVTRRKVEPSSSCSPPTRTELLRGRGVRRHAVSLVCGVGPSARAFRVGGEPLSLGGSADNRIALSDRAVSRYHCRIEPADVGCAVRDLGSTNGTFVDGVRVSRQPLRPGAVLRVGRTELRVVDRGDGQGEPSDFVVASPEMLSVMASVDQFARLPWPALIQGETGVGKEHVARALHERGPRAKGPFVALNGGGLPRELIESELFGHERGAFTGAQHARRGAFEQADQGTLFLDEVAELPLDLQTRLLRVLETWRVRRLGGESDRSVDIRLVCATHQDLRARVRDGTFRADLFYRIHRLVVEVAPLRSRRHDVEPLAQHFLRRAEPTLGPRVLTDAALERLVGYPWPGNVRELRNVVELAAVDCDGATVDVSSVERALSRSAQCVASGPSADTLREALEHYGGNLSATARALGIPRSTLRDRLRGAPGREA